jgi:hypothetical protein
MQGGPRCRGIPARAVSIAEHGAPAVGRPTGTRVTTLQVPRAPSYRKAPA